MKKLNVFILSGLLCMGLSSCSPPIETGLMPGQWSGYINDEEVIIDSAYIVDGEDISVSEDEFEAVRQEQTVFLVINGGHLTITDSKITKSDYDNKAVLDSAEGGDKNLDKNIFIVKKEKKDTDAKDEASPNDDKTGAEKEISPSDDNKSSGDEKGDEKATEKDEKPANNLTTKVKPAEETKEAADGGEDASQSNDFTAEKSEDTTDFSKYEKYGVNSAIVCVGEDSLVTIENCTIETDAEYGNAVFAVSGGIVDIKNSTIITRGLYSQGLTAAYGGSINADKVKITTSGDNSTGISVERDCIMTFKNGAIDTSGIYSPLIYSMGNAIVTDSRGVASATEPAVTGNNNSIAIERCQFSSAAKNSEASRQSMEVPKKEKSE